MGARSLAALACVAIGVGAIASASASRGELRVQVSAAPQGTGTRSVIRNLSMLQQAPSNEQTHPHLHPPLGRRHTAFAILFTMREEPGHHGILAVAYRIGVIGPTHQSPFCAPPQPPTIEDGAAGTVARVRLPSPAHGWCAGHYRATVYLQRGPYCPPPLQGQPPTPCPLFATQELDTGNAVFTVKARRQLP